MTTELLAEKTGSVIKTGTNQSLFITIPSDWCQILNISDKTTVSKKLMNGKHGYFLAIHANETTGDKK